MSDNHDLIVRLEANVVQLRMGLNQAERMVDQTTNRMRQDVGKLDRAFAALAATGAGLFAGFGLIELGQQFYQVNKSFQDLEAGLKTATGSAEAAAAAFEAIRSFARETPYDVQQVTTAFIRLKNLGLDASQDAMRAYGDIAAAMPGKTMLDFVEAVADAATGEFERLKEFGIKASSEGDRVRITFRGVTQEIAKNAAEIERHLIGLAQANFGGAMAEKMDKLSGKASNLKDSLDDLFVTIGQRGAVDTMADALDMAIGGVEGLTDNLDVLMEIMGLLAALAAGRLTAALLTAASAQASVTASTLGAHLAFARMIGISTAATARMMAASVAARGLGAALTALGGPMGAAITVTAGAVYLLSTRQTEAEEAAEAAARSEEAFRAALEDMGDAADGAAGDLKKLTGAKAELARINATEAIAEQEEAIVSAQARMRGLLSRAVWESAGQGPEAERARLDMLALLQGEVIDTEAAMGALSRASEATGGRFDGMAKSAAELAAGVQDATAAIGRQKDILAVLNGSAPAPQDTEDTGKPAGTGSGSTDDKRAGKIKKVVEALRFEREQLVRNAEDQAVYNALKQAGISASDPEAAQIRKAAVALYEQEQRLEGLNEDLEREQKLMADGKALAEELRTAQEAYNDEMERLDALLAAGAINQETYGRAAQKAAEDLAKAQNKVSDAAQEVGDAFARNFDRAVLEGGKLRDMLGGILQDITAIALRRAVTAPLGNAIGAGLGSIFGFADGGVMTSQGPLPLRKYSRGGIANSAQVAVFGEGSTPEAYVPVPSGRIPVELRGLNVGGGGTVVQVIDQRQGGAPVKTERGRMPDGRELVRMILTEVSKDIANNGQVGRTIQSTYGNQRQGVPR